jgi:magnesium-transporting ATPase (P-type)
LQRLLKVRANVQRDGRRLLVDAEDLVPGGTVLLESGEKVPAGRRLMQVNNLAIDEDLLTGADHHRGGKKTDLQERQATVSDRHNRH